VVKFVYLAILYRLTHTTALLKPKWVVVLKSNFKFHHAGGLLIQWRLWPNVRRKDEDSVSICLVLDLFLFGEVARKMATLNEVIRGSFPYCSSQNCSMRILIDKRYVSKYLYGTRPVQSCRSRRRRACVALRLRRPPRRGNLAYLVGVENTFHDLQLPSEGYKMAS
jgi:hypothetical protein